MDKQSDQFLGVLVEMFPDSDVERLAGALRQADGSLDAAVAQLLGGAKDVDANCVGDLPPQKHAPGRTPSHSGRLERRHQLPVASPSAARHPTAPSSSAAAADRDRPGGSRTSARVRRGGGWQSLTNDQAQQIGAGHGSYGIWGSEPPSGAQGRQAHTFRAARPREPGAPAAVPVAERMAPAGAISETGAPSGSPKAMLLKCHEWAGVEVIEAVLAAVRQDAGAAERLLSAMGAGPEGIGDGETVTKGQDKEDVYWKHRWEAVRLGRKLRKLQKQLAAAQDCGDYSKGRQLGQEVQQLRATVVRLHWEAAEAITSELNGPTDSPEDLRRLDLHGLHVEEALAVLDRRLSRLEAGQDRADRMPRKVTVIVGRGKHSSGSEASIPRAVEAFLAERGNNFAPGKIGCLEVRARHVARLPHR